MGILVELQPMNQYDEKKLTLQIFLEALSQD